MRNIFPTVGAKVLMVVQAATLSSANTEIDRKVETLLSQMTLEEKLDYIRGIGFAIALFLISFYSFPRL